MAFLNVRAFECVLCGERFTLLCADFIVQESLICDACLAALWPLEGAALREDIAARLAARDAEADRRADEVQREGRANRIAQYVEGLKQRCTAVEAILEDRAAGRRAYAILPGDVDKQQD